MNKTSINLGTFAVRNAEGNIDHEATLLKFAEVISTWEIEAEQAEGAIRQVVSAIFDQYKGATLNKKFITGQALRQLNATPENWTEMEDKVSSYLKNNSQGEVAEDGTHERPNSLFVTRPGKGGGTFRRADERTSAKQ